jgi:hypothetical protein
MSTNSSAGSSNANAIGVAGMRDEFVDVSDEEVVTADKTTS